MLHHAAEGLGTQEKLSEKVRRITFVGNRIVWSGSIAPPAPAQASHEWFCLSPRCYQEFSPILASSFGVRAGCASPPLSRLRSRARSAMSALLRVTRARTGRRHFSRRRLLSMTLFGSPASLCSRFPPKSYDSRARLRRPTCLFSPPPWGSLKRKRQA
jgi:hypothetical protein